MEPLTKPTWKDKLKSLPPFSWRKQRAKTPTVLQMEAVECGAASLGIVLGYHGRFVPLEELRVACGVSRDGSKASHIVKAARKYGLMAKGYRYGPQSVKSLSMPVIAHWNFNHFLVVEGFHKDTVYLNDPATGPRTVQFEEFDQSFTGVVLVFEKGQDFKKGGKKPSLIKALYQRLKGTEGALAYVVLASLALVIPGLAIPIFNRVFVDFYLVSGRIDWVWLLLLAMSVTIILRTILTWLQQHYLLRLETKLTLSNASQLLWHILRLPIEFFTQRWSGDVCSRVDMNDRVAQLLSGELSTTLLNIVLIIFYAGLMLQYSVPMTLIGIGIAILNLIALRLISRKRTDANQKLIQEMGKMAATAYNGLQSIETIKATGSESDFFTRWSGYQTKVINTSQDLGVATQVLSVIPTFLYATTIVAILTIGGLSIMNGEITIGMLVAFQSLMFSFLSPVNQMVNLGGQLQEMEGTLNKLDDVLQYRIDPQVEIAESVEQVLAGKSKLSGFVELKNVTFGYNRLSPPLIENFNLKLEPGSRVALVGGSGSGKSTIARLVAGLYEPWDGQILFDAKPRRQIHRTTLNNSLSVVSQEIFLFKGQVRDNLSMWDAGIPEEDILQAAKDAYVHQEISSRPGGYHSLIEEGGRNFSGGQRQRLEIARALVSNPTVLVLDEATSALDPLTEQIIDNNLRRRGCTCLIIAHRLSTIRDCDEIIVLDQGKIVQRGTHEQLWRSGGAYTRLIRAETPESEFLTESLLESLYQ